MSISYSGIIGHTAKATMPSVSNWKTNMNIIRDPPKSITTRRINKVGETSEITLMIDGSGDRVAENINLYPRGVNPMVKVQYSNNGTSGGQVRQANGASQNTNSIVYGGAGKLPYRIMNDGAFYAPIMTQFNERPLSRLPRAWTYAFSNPGMPNYLSNARCQDSKWERAIRDSVMNVDVKPTATYKMEKAMVPDEVVSGIEQEVLRQDINNNKGYMDITQQQVMIPQNNINNNKINEAYAKTQKGSRFTKSGETRVNVEKFTIPNPIRGQQTTNRGRDFMMTPIEEMKNIKTKDNLNVSAKTNISSKSSGGDKFMHSEFIYNDTNLPKHNFTANTTGTGDTTINNSREYNLTPKINANQARGDYRSQQNIPVLQRAGSERETMNSRADDLKKKAYQAFHERNQQH